MRYWMQTFNVKFVVALLFFVSTGAFLQGQSPYIKKGKLLIGSSFGSSGYADRHPVTSEETWALSVTMQPRIGVFVTDNVLLAVQGEIQITRSSFPDNWLNDEYYGIGGLGRYYFPILAHVFPFSKEQFQSRVKGFGEVGGYFKNGNIQGDSLVSLPSMSIFELQLGGGVSIQLIKSLCLEFSMFYVTRPDSRYEVAFPITPRLGLELIIPSTK